jgi:subtilase family serine protease
MGPGSWDGAKQAIEKAHGNTIYATKTRDTKQPASSSSTIVVIIVAVVVAIIAIACLIKK